MTNISALVSAIAPSRTLAVSAKAKAMKAQGIDVIGLGRGEPDFGTPDYIKAAGIAAIEEGYTTYVLPTSGSLELKAAIGDKLRRDNGLEYEPEQILVTCGAKHALYLLFRSILNIGDEVIIPAPYWVSYPEQVKSCGGVPTFIETDSSFKISAEQFADAITPRTRAIVVNSPANPTGAVYSKDELEGIAQVAVDKDVIVISDEIYEKIIYDGAVHVSIASLGSEIKERCFVVNGVSKTYAMTGWRIGYVAGDKEAIAAAGRLLDQSTSNACSIAQRASIAALTGGDETVKAMVAEFDKRRRFIHKRANEVFQADAPLPKGAFYFFADVSSLLGKKYKGRTLESSMDVADFMLDEARVAGVPGGAFGADSYMRLSYACSMEEITEGMDRVEKAITVLS